MLKTFDSSTMTEVPRRSHADRSDDSTTASNPSYTVPQPTQLSQPPRRQQWRSCDSCRRGKRACDADKRVDFANQTCSNCLRKNQICTFNWLKTASESHQERERKRRRSSVQSGNGHIEDFTSTRSLSYYSRASVNSAINRTYRQIPNQGKRSLTSLSEDDEQDDRLNIQSDNTEDGSNEPISIDDLNSVQSDRSAEQSSLMYPHSQRNSPDVCRYARNRKNDASSPFMDILLGEKTSRGFVTNGFLQIYNDSMENSLSCWLTEHNCPYTMTRYKPSIHSASEATRAWGGSWSNRMYNRVIQLDRAYASLRTRDLTPEEERTVSKALNMTIMSFASQWAQAGERGTNGCQAESRFTANGFPQSNEFERSMQETLWHQTSQLLHRAAGIDSFRVVFALIIFSQAQRPVDTTRPFLRTDSKLKTHYEKFQALVQDDDAPIFLEIALRQLLAQRRRLERVEQEMASQGNSERDPLRQEDRDTFNLLYWLGVMFDTLSAAIYQRPVVVDDEDSELPRPHRHEHADSAALNSPSNIYANQFAMPRDPPNTFTNAQASQASESNDVWGDLFTRDGTLEVNPGAARWPCSYKLAASTLSSAAPVKVLLYRRVAQLQASVSRKASPVRIELGINAAFQVYNHWQRSYAPFFSDCVKHHATLPTRVQSWYILLLGHWHLGTFLLSDLLLTIDATNLSSPNERSCRQASNLVATLRRQNALAVADLSLASIHSVKDKAESEDFHFALRQSALLTEPWTVVFVRSLCRAGYILVQIAASDSNGEERDHARRRCGDCIEGLWYLGRKSDMAFLAARYLSDMLEEAIRDTSARKVFDEEGSDSIPTVSSQFDTNSSPGTDVPGTGYQQPFGSTGAFSQWSVDDLMGSCQPTNKLNERDVLNLAAPINVDSALLWDDSLQC